MDIGRVVHSRQGRQTRVGARAQQAQEHGDKQGHGGKAHTEYGIPPAYPSHHQPGECEYENCESCRQ